METQQWSVKQQQSAETENGDQEDIAISEKARRLIGLILEQMKELSNAEKYLLYLKLFQISNVGDPLRQPLNPLGSRSEINRTISWIKTHLEEDAETSLPKQEVYEEYTVYCSQNQIKSLSQADFGKVMKQVYPKVRARRLGTRGNSRYCYSGLRRCIKLKPPKLPDLDDKPLSTEAPCTQLTLTAASWVIVKEWSELHFKVSFSSLQALAKFLVVSHSIGAGTEAANQLTTVTDSHIKGDGKTGIKHKEMQLQLQKKIQQKNEVKERKRKIQSPKNEAKSVNNNNNNNTTKKAKSVPSTPIRLEDASPTSLTGAGESSTTSTISTGSTSTSTSPTQGKSICDKAFEFTTTTTTTSSTTTQLPALPDFKSFQKPICEQLQNGGGAKVAIPRLTLKGRQQRSPHSSPKKQIKNAKYKAIQPKPPQQASCDNASYNPQQFDIAADIRSQGVDRFIKQRSDDDCDPPVFSLPRERLESISNVDKDAMDEYLGTNNSQHEEELSKYFSNNSTMMANDTSNTPTTTKISQLRQLLEQNGISDNKNFLTQPQTKESIPNQLLDPLTLQTVNLYTNPTIIPTQSQAKRRVSFDTAAVPREEVVPPSPNTRRKNFSFTPISPGPQSPTNTVSPFVSPTNTPVPRSKTSNNHMKKIKREPGLTLDGNREIKLASSAPASPMLCNKSVLEKLLHSNSKVTYTPDYVVNAIKQDPSELENYHRSQSVPINQMVKTSFPDDLQCLQTLTNQNTDFNDFDSITESVNVNRIIDSLDDDNSSIDIYNVSSQIDQFSFNMEMNFPPYQPKINPPPSRSVPNTPLSFNRPQQIKDYTNHNSRSYPSTPLLVDSSPFNYDVNADCLLNGQPIRTPRDPSAYFIVNDTAAEDNNIERHLPPDEFNNQLLMDENDVLIGTDQNYNH